MTNVKWKPDHVNTLTSYLTVKDAAAAIEFYKKAFGAQEIYRMPGPGGKLMHAELKIGDSTLMLADEFPEMGHKSPLALGGTPVTICMYCENVDKVWEQATAAGAKVQMPLNNMFWGDRYGHVVDPYGHRWALMQHIEDVSPEEMQRRSADAAKQMAGKH